MNIKIDKQDIDYLHNSRMQSFVNEQSFRFELIKPFKKPLDCHNKGTLHWCGENYLNALILFRWFESKKVKSQILWDTVENPNCQYVVWSETKFK
tara:strand:- start:279 stop:563 length:285 start_codon:yes stop_codon:yes gene_type:complete